MENQTNQCSDLIVKASYTRKPRFKPGSELSGRPNKKVMSIEVNDELTEDSEIFDITLHLKSCEIHDCDS